MSVSLRTVTARSEQDMLDLGAALSKTIQPGDIACLRGDLGAGKTVLARGFVQALCGVETDVPSPTYNLVLTYEAPEFEIWHFDLYRLENPNDVRELGWEDALDGGVCLIEWPERIEELLPESRLDIRLQAFEHGERRAVLEGCSVWRRRLDAWMEAPQSPAGTDE